MLRATAAGGDIFDRAIMADLRASRSAPPGRADKGARRATYGAAMQQFEDLMTASLAIGPSTQPILSYYALNQIGRAISAAYCTDNNWQLRGHGLSFVSAPSINDVAVAPSGTGAFQRVAEITGSEQLAGRLTVAELWASLPELWSLRLPGNTAPPSLPVVPRIEPDMSPMTLRLLLPAVPMLKASDPNEDDIWAALSPYPQFSRERWSIQEPSGNGVVNLERDLIKDIGELRDSPAYAEGIGGGIYRKTAQFPAVYFCFRWFELLEGDTEVLWCRPQLPTAQSTPSRLMTWWLLSYALSMLARYEPAAWTEMLRVDSSPIAVRLEKLLGIAISNYLLLPAEALKIIQIERYWKKYIPMEPDTMVQNLGR